jgi:hypothetical protein
MSERYRGPEFSTGAETHEPNPERLLLDQARSAALEMLHGSEDPLTHEIARKILAKINIKERVDELMTHADDITAYQELKKLGIFVVHDTQATFDYEDTETGLSLHQGDKYLDLHLPPVAPGLRSRDAVESSLNLVGQYIKAHNLRPKYLMGVTYERMAKIAERRFGFSVAYPNPDSLPEGVVRGVQRVYEGFTQAGANHRDIGVPAIVFMETTSLLQTEERQPSTVQNIGNLLVREIA